MNGYPQSLIDANSMAEGGVGVELGRVCIANNYPINDLAIELNVSKRVVYEWFTGNSDPSPDLRDQIIEIIESLEASREDKNINYISDLGVKEVDSKNERVKTLGFNDMKYLNEEEEEEEEEEEFYLSSSTENKPVTMQALKWVAKLFLEHIANANTGPKYNKERAFEAVKAIKLENEITIKDIAQLIDDYDISCSKFISNALGEIQFRSIDETDYSASSFNELTKSIEREEALNALSNYSKLLIDEQLDLSVNAALKNLEVKLLNRAMHGYGQMSCLLLPPNDVRVKKFNYSFFSNRLLKLINDWGFSEPNHTLQVKTVSEVFYNFFEQLEDLKDKFGELKKEFLRDFEFNKMHLDLYGSSNKYLQYSSLEAIGSIQVITFDMVFNETGYEFKDSEIFSQNLLDWMNDLDGQRIIKKLFSEMIRAKKEGADFLKITALESKPLILCVYDGQDFNEPNFRKEYSEFIREFEVYANEELDFVDLLSEESYVVFDIELPLKVSHVKHIFELLGYDISINCNVPFKGAHEFIIQIPN